MLIALILSLTALLALAALFWLSAQRLAQQTEQISFLQQEKARFDTLTTIIQNTVTNGGWLTVQHNGNMIPFGPLLDKMEPISERVN